MTPTFKDILVDSGVILLAGYLSYMVVWVVVKTVQKNSKESN